MIACVNLPELPLQLLMQRHPDWREFPAVVVDRDNAQGVILWANERARRFRILPGMRYASALSLSSDLRAGVVPDSEVETCVSSLIERLRFYTPHIEPSTDEPGVLWLDASGLSLLYPSLGKWSGLIHDDLTREGFRNSVVLGFSRFGVYATAKTTTAITIFDTPDAERKHTRTVKLDRLGVDPAFRDTLFKLGITTVGGFLELPANGIKKRFGADVFRLYQLATDELFAPLVPRAPQEPIRVSLHLDYAESNLERLMAVIEKHLHALLSQLGERAEVLAAVAIKLSFDGGGNSSERLLPATPTLDVAQIADLMALRLASIDMPAGVADIEIEVEGTSASRCQGELFVEKSPRDLEAGARAFARLRAELGDDAVVRARLRAAHLPEAQFAWEPMHTLEIPRARDVRLPPLIRRIYGRPVLFAPGSRNPDAELIAHIDDGSVQETMGPYIVSGGWWQREVQREYYYVRTANGRSLWMYYDRRRMCWFIHGEVE